MPRHSQKLSRIARERLIAIDAGKPDWLFPRWDMENNPDGYWALLDMHKGLKNLKAKGDKENLKQCEVVCWKHLAAWVPLSTQ